MSLLGTISTSSPADRRMGAVLRAVVMSVASSALLTVDRVEDSALAVNEAFRAIVEHVPPDSEVGCSIEAEEGAIRVSVTGNGLAPDRLLDELGERILASIADDVERIEGVPGLRFTIANR